MTKKTKQNTIKKKTNKTSKKINQEKKISIRNINLKVTLFILFIFGVLFIFATYAWFSVNLNVKVKNFNMIVTKNSGLSISFDAIDWDTNLEISADKLVRELKNTYPNNTSQWAAMGLVPVSTNGISSPNNDKFDIYVSTGVEYRNKSKDNGFIEIQKAVENRIREYNTYIAFDLFFKNDTGSPIEDYLFLEESTEITIEEDASEEMVGLLNSIRVGFVKIGTTALDTNPTTIQNLTCNNNCMSRIYEPLHTEHTDLSIERAQNVNVNLVNGTSFPTYGCIREGGPIYIKNTVSGSPNMDYNYFRLQETITSIDEPLFSIPNGITKTRVYVWIEGQDIDSLETDSEGADLDISISFIKDMTGYTEY